MLKVWSTKTMWNLVQPKQTFSDSQTALSNAIDMPVKQMLRRAFAATMLSVIVAAILITVFLLDSAARYHVKSDRLVEELLLSRRTKFAENQLGSTARLRALKEKGPGDVVTTTAGAGARSGSVGRSGDFCLASVEFKKDNLSGNYSVVCSSLTTPARTSDTLVNYGDVWGFYPSLLEADPILWTCKVRALHKAACEVEFVAWANLANQLELKSGCRVCSYRITRHGVWLRENAGVCSTDDREILKMDLKKSRKIYQDQWEQIKAFPDC